jgi:hypothetical protein
MRGVSQALSDAGDMLLVCGYSYCQVFVLQRWLI